MLTNVTTIIEIATRNKNIVFVVSWLAERLTESETYSLVG